MVEEIVEEQPVVQVENIHKEPTPKVEESKDKIINAEPDENE